MRIPGLSRYTRSPARCLHALNTVLIAAAALALFACDTAPRIPDYSAPWPDVPAEAPVANGSIFQPGREVALFENSIARRVGDSVTIVLVESTNASKSSSTTTKKGTALDLAAPTILGKTVTINGNPIGASMDHSSSFDGSGDSSQSNSLTGEITVTVVKRLPNGNLLVRGQKWLTLNQGSEFVRLQGIVRPADIASDNSVPSTKVADAVISYGGRGALADANAPGLLSRFFNSKWMPF